MSTPTVARTCLDMGSTSKTLCSIWFATNRRLSGRGSPETPGGSRTHAKKQIPRKRWFTIAPFREGELPIGRKCSIRRNSVVHTHVAGNCRETAISNNVGGVKGLPKMLSYEV